MLKHNKIKTETKTEDEWRKKKYTSTIGNREKWRKSDRSEPNTCEWCTHPAELLIFAYLHQTGTWAQAHIYVWYVYKSSLVCLESSGTAYPHHTHTHNITLRLQFSTELDSSVCYTHFLISNAWLYVRLTICRREREPRVEQNVRAHILFLLRSVGASVFDAARKGKRKSMGASKQLLYNV